MALQIAYTTQYGIDVPEAYARITTYRGDKDRIDVTVEVHAHAAARNADKVPVDRLVVTMQIPNGSKFAGMYAELRLDPRFSAALDV